MSLEDVKKLVKTSEADNLALKEKVEEELKKLYPIGTVFKYGQNKYIVLEHIEHEVKLYEVKYRSIIEVKYDKLLNVDMIKMLYTIDEAWLEQFKMTL